MAKRILDAISKSNEISSKSQGSENFENVYFTNDKKPKPVLKEVEIPLIEWVRAGWEVPKLIRKGVNLIALEESMDKKDIAHALLDYALKHKDKINFRKYHKPKNN